MSKSLKRVKAALEAAAIDATILEMPGETRTALAAATEANCEIDQIAKSIIFQGASSGRVILFITAGGRSVDNARAAKLAGEELGRADPAFVRATTGFAIGGVAPIGHLVPPIVFMDRTLFEFDVIYAAAGTPRHIFSVTPQDLKQVSGAQISDFSSQID